MFSTTTPWAQYSGNDSATEFAFEHLFYNDSDIKVYHTDTAGVITLLTITTDYTLAGLATDPNDDETEGEVTYPVSGAPLATGEKLTIWRQPDLTQTQSLTTDTGWFGAPLEIRLDLAVMMIQWLDLHRQRSIKQAMTEAVGNMEIPALADRISKLLGFDTAGDLIAVATTAGIVPAIDVSMDVTNFNTFLSATENTLQKVSDKLDDGMNSVLARFDLDSGGAGKAIPAGIINKAIKIKKRATILKVNIFSTVAGVLAAKSISLDLYKNGSKISGTDPIVLTAQDDVDFTTFASWTGGARVLVPGDLLHLVATGTPDAEKIEVSIESKA